MNAPRFSQIPTPTGKTGGHATVLTDGRKGPCERGYSLEHRSANGTGGPICFTISPDPARSGKYYVVWIFETRRAMHRAEPQIHGFEALCDQFTRREWRSPAPEDVIPIGRLLFWRGCFDPGTIAHEILHAALGYLHWAKVRVRMNTTREWRRALCPAPAGEEKLAEVVEHLTTEFYEQLHINQFFPWIL
jgi:hypothetical protein